MQRKRSLVPSLFFYLIRSLFVLGITFAIGGACAIYLWAKDLGVFSLSNQDLAKIEQWQPVDNTIVYDRSGQKIGEFFKEYHIFTPYKELPEHVVQAIIAIEDHYFFQHHGIDIKAIARAGLVHFGLHRSRYTQGASTITQQIVRHFLLSREKSFARKAKEIALALRLETMLTKERILELYANNLFLGSGAYGVGAAAKRYFNKKIGDLELHEAALIAGLFQSPSRYNPHKFPERAKERQKLVLQAMAQNKFISLEQAKEALKRPLSYVPYQSIHGEIAPYFVDYIKEEVEKILSELNKQRQDKQFDIGREGFRVYTTLDLHLQSIAEQAVKKNDPVFEVVRKAAHAIERNGQKIEPTVEGALLSVDPRNGEILAMVGGRDYKKSNFNRTTMSYRSPGSSFKPIVYSLALDRKFKWSDVIFVSPITLGGHYRPKNSSKDYLTETTLLRAFYRSMNTPTMELADKIGIAEIVERAVQLGIKSPIKVEMSSVLGSSGATMLDMARVNSVFANEGKLTELMAISKIVNLNGDTIYEAPTVAARQKQVITPQTAFLIVQGMKDVFRRGTGASKAYMAEWACGKTGTSNESKDNWFNGYTTDLVTISWVGTDEHAPIDGSIHGARAALPMWDEYMKEAIKLRPSKPFTVPEGVVMQHAHPQYGHAAAHGIPMWFHKDHLPTREGAALEFISSSGGNYRETFSQ